MTRHTVFFATNRNLLAESPVAFGNAYNENGPYQVRYGSAEVELPGRGGDDEGEVASINLAREVLPPAEGTPGERVLGSTEVFNGLRERLERNKSDLLILIHGFSCSFGAALTRAAQLSVAYGTRSKPLEVAVFSWPSDGKTLANFDGDFRLPYFSDRTDAEASRGAVARALLRLADFLNRLPREQWCGQKLHLVAHSMGNYVLRHALQSLSRDFKTGALPRLFENIFLMAADEDDDALELPHKLARLHEMTVNLHVYYALEDLALRTSDKSKGNPSRLGTAGPRTLSDLPRRLFLVDCTAVCDIPGAADGMHQYYRARPEVVADVREVLAGNPAGGKDRDYVSSQRAYRILRAPPKASRRGAAAAGR